MFNSGVLQNLSYHMSVRSAVEQGTEMLELDCHFTKDGHVVVSHDENLLRQTGLDVNVSSLDLKVGGRILQHCLLGQRSQSTVMWGHVEVSFHASVLTMMGFVHHKRTRRDRMTL